MSANGPGDKPAVVRRRAARERRRQQRQRTNSARAQQQAYVSQGRAVEHAAHQQASRPAPSEVRDTKGDADRARATTFQRSPRGREAVRDTYAEQSPQRRRQIADASKGRAGEAAHEVERFHEERKRVEAFKALARHFSERAAHDPSARPSSPEQAEAIRKGLRVLDHQRQAAIAAIRQQEYTDPRYAPGETHQAHGLLHQIAQVVGQSAGTGGPKEKGAVAANQSFLNAQKRVEKETGPIEAGYNLALKPTVDATSKILEETNRPISGVAGGAIAAVEGENAAKGALEGFKHNDKSFTELVKKAGVHGPAAVILGTAADIALDPTTYLSFGLKAPATAAERVAARNLAKKMAPAVRKAAKAGDEEAQARLAREYEDQLAAARRKAGRLESETRGVQVGVRLPGGRQLQTRGRATAAVGKQATRVTSKVQASRATAPINEVLRALSPHVRPQGVSKAAHVEQKAIEREASALRNRVAREGRELGKYVQRVTGGDVEQVRAIVDAIESDTIRNLPEKLRAAAERVQEYHARVADDYEKLTGKPLRLMDVALPKQDVDAAVELARKVTEPRVARAERAAQDADIEENVVHKLGDSTDVVRAGSKSTDKAVDLAAAEELAGRVGPAERVTDRTAEQDLVDRLAGVVENLRQDAHANIARTRTNDELGAIRRGEHDAPEVKKALHAADFYAQKARDLRKAGNRTGARAAEAKAREARAVIKAHRAEVEPQHLAAVRDEGADVLKGRAGALEKLVGRLQERVAEETPEGYVPRQTVEAMDRAAQGAPPPRAGTGRGAVGHEQQRLERRRMADIRQEHPDRYSEELPQLEAQYGTKMGRRLGALSLFTAMTKQFARPATLENLAEEGGVIYRVDSKGPQRIDPNDARANEQAAAEVELAHALGEETPYLVIPEPIDEALTKRLKQSERKSDSLELYDRALRAFKAANTVLRPGFFLTTIAGNMWQGFLADVSPRELGRAWRMLSHVRAENLRAVDPGASRRIALLDRAAPESFPVDGRMVPFSELFEEAIRSGAVRTGSRLGDPVELSLERQATRRLKGKGPAAAVEWMGQLAEDLDDMTKAMLYVHARSKLGLDPRAATEFAFSKMIDYSDLSEVERRIFKRVMPFYVYTARNLPIQVKSIIARPGKLANFQKLRNAMAEVSGLPADWETQRTEAEQERMPFPTPFKSHGFTVFLDPRIPVADLAAPAQFAEGGGGVQRTGERYLSNLAPFIKAPLELQLGRRLDYDRPINTPGYPPAAGALEKLLGLTQKGTFIQPATGEHYVGAKPSVDYLIRVLGGSPGSLAVSLGADTADRSNLPGVVRGAATFAGGVGLSASDPLNANLDAVRKLAEQRYAKRSDLKGRGLRNSAEDIRNERAIDALNDLKAKIQATMGFPEQKARVLEFERNRLDRELAEPAEITAERRRMESLRRRYGG